MKRYQLIICKVLQREAYYCAARSKNIIDITLIQQGLHNEPEELGNQLAESLKTTTDIAGKKYDAQLLGYGLCSNGIVGLSCEIPIVVPRGHDCMTLLLGSKKKYQDYFDTHKGIYWYSGGWIENALMPGKKRVEKLMSEYEEKYGPHNADYLMKTEQSWMREYQYATFIDWGLGESEKYKEYTKECAEFMDWQYDEIEGDSGLMQRFVDGQWSEEEFLQVSPGKKIAGNLTKPGIITAE